MWQTIFDGLKVYGAGAAIAGVLLYILYKILSSNMKDLKEDRDNYMKIIDKQNITQNNHIQHLDNAVKAQSQIIAQQGERFTAGIERICHALESQTDILKEHIKNSRRT